MVDEADIVITALGQQTAAAGLTAAQRGGVAEPDLTDAWPGGAHLSEANRTDVQLNAPT